MMFQIEVMLHESGSLGSFFFGRHLFPDSPRCGDLPRRDPAVPGAVHSRREIMEAMRRHVPAPPYVLLALATLFWSGNFVLGRAVSARIPPVGMAFWRWAGALAVLLPLSYPRLKEQWPLLRRSWKTLVPLGVLGVGSFNTLVYVGLHDTTATNAVLLNSACPAFIAAITFLIRGQRATRRQGTGILVSLLGVTANVSRGIPQTLLSLSFNP